MRFNERSFVVLVAGLLVAAIAGALAFTVLGEDDPAGDTAPADNAAAAFAGGPDEVLLLNGNALVRRNVEEQSEEIVGEIPSPSVYAAPGSQWIAYIASDKASRNEDFAAAPVLHLYDGADGDETTVGPGVAPVWNTAGTHVAFLQPVEPRECVGETCSGDTQIGVVEAGAEGRSLLLDPGRHSILGWVGDRVAVGNFDDPSTVTLVSLDDERTKLDMPPTQYWGGSPDGRWVVKSNAKKTEFISVENGELGEERIVVELGQQELLQGSWSHDSTTVAAVTSLTSGVHKGKELTLVNEEQTTQVVTFSPDDPEPALVELTYGASGDVVWAPDNEAIVFSSLIDPKRALFQARHCPLGNSGGCSIVTSWTEGVVLLRAE